MSEDPKVRALAVSVLAKLDGGKLDAADAAIEEGARRFDRSGPRLGDERGRRPRQAPWQRPRRICCPSWSRSLGSGPWADRRVAVRVLGKLGAGGDLAVLLKAASDASSFVREAVAESVRADRQGLDVLLALSRDEIAQVRAAAARGLAGSKDERAQRRRTELQSDPEKVVRQAAGGA